VTPPAPACRICAAPGADLCPTCRGILRSVGCETRADIRVAESLASAVASEHISDAKTRGYE
jgi:hypothetical protein